MATKITADSEIVKQIKTRIGRNYQYQLIVLVCDFCGKPERIARFCHSPQLLQNNANNLNAFVMPLL